MDGLVNPIPITSTDDLAALCVRLAEHAVITVDTEFMRDRTYWPKLCLIQVASEAEAHAIDPLAEGLDLTPFFTLMRNPDVLKVFHAARQDLEIFHNLMDGAVPGPLFDTQVAAMVCGFGEQVGYETLVNKLAKASVDKTQRFTDWARRPLTEKQITYALADVTHLRVVFRKLFERLQHSGRGPWLNEEMEVLGNPATYCIDPEAMYLKVKGRTRSGRFLAVLQGLAAWRERAAQERDLPRQRILKDEALLEIAAQPPGSIAELANLRGVPKGVAEGKLGPSIIEAVAAALALPSEQWPQAPERVRGAGPPGPVADLLRVLLKACCEEADVAQKLVASSADLDRLATEDHPDISALHGWRRDVFGARALELKAGHLALGIDPETGALRAITAPPTEL